MDIPPRLSLAILAFFAATIVSAAENPTIWYGHTGEVTCLAISLDGRRVASGSADKTVRLWDAATGQSLAVFGQPEKDLEETPWPGSVAGPDSPMEESPPAWAAGPYSGTEDEAPETPIVAVAFSTDGRSVLSVGDELALNRWDIATGRPIVSHPGHGIFLYSAAFSPDGRRVLAGGDDRALHLWNFATDREIRYWWGDFDYVAAVAFSRDGTRAVMGGSTPEIWDVPRGTVPIYLSGKTEVLLAAALSPDGQTVVTGGVEDSIKVWDAHTGELRAIWQEHFEPVRALTFSPDSRLVLSGSEDLTVRLWDAATGRCLKVWTGHTDHVRAVAFFPDGRRALSAGDDQTLRVWDVASVVSLPGQ